MTYNSQMCSLMASPWMWTSRIKSFGRQNKI